MDGRQGLPLVPGERVSPHWLQELGQTTRNRLFFKEGLERRLGPDSALWSERQSPVMAVCSLI
jgi:hypothetical protein